MKLCNALRDDKVSAGYTKEMEYLSIAGAADLAIAGIVTAVFIIYSWWRDTGHLILIAIAMPVAGFFYTHLPYHDELTTLSPLGNVTEPLLFLFFLLLSTWVIRRTIGTGMGGTRPIHVITTSVALTLLLLAFAYHIVPTESLHNFGPLFDSIFGSNTSFFWITALALLALFVV